MCPLVTPPGAKPPTFCGPKARSRSPRTVAARPVSPARLSRSVSSSSAPPCRQVRACGRPAGQRGRDDACVSLRGVQYVGHSGRSRPGWTALAYRRRRDRRGTLRLIGAELDRAVPLGDRALAHAREPSRNARGRSRGTRHQDDDRARSAARPQTSLGPALGHLRHPPAGQSPSGQCSGTTPSACTSGVRHSPTTLRLTLRDRRYGGLVMIGFIIAGLIIGALARLIKPGKQNLGILATLGLGLVGSVIGGLIASASRHRQHLGAQHPRLRARGGRVRAAHRHRRGRDRRQEQQSSSTPEPCRKTCMADPIRVYLLDDHDVVREGLRFLLERTEDIEVVGESAHRGRGDGTDPGAATRRRGPRRAAAGRLRHRGVPGGAGRRPVDQGPHPDVVRRRRGAVRRDHGRRLRLRAQGDPQQRPGRARSARWPPASP